MDQIKNMISATDPVHNDPSVPDAGAALRRSLTEAGVFSDSLPRNVRSLADRRSGRARLAGGLAIAAAAVTAVVLVATNLGGIATAPAPANSGIGLGTASSTPTPPATPTASATPSASATPAPEAAVGHGECTVENVRAVEGWVAEQLPSMQVSGCAGGWMALMSGEPVLWFYMARLVDGTYVADTTQPWGQIAGWLTASLNDDRLTAVEYMDREFTTKGIPLDLRKQLVGEPPAGSLAAEGIKTGGTQGVYDLQFFYPAAWKVEITPGEAPDYATYRHFTDAGGKDAITLREGEQHKPNPGGCLNDAPYKVLDSHPMPDLPFDASTSSPGTPRFVYVALTSEANDGGPVQAALGITSQLEGDEGIACVLDLSVSGPDGLDYYSFGTQRWFGGPAWGRFRFNTLEEAAAFTRTAEYQGIKTVVTSLTVVKGS